MLPGVFTIPSSVLYFPGILYNKDNIDMIKKPVWLGISLFTT